MSKRDHLIVKIVADKPVQYSTDNGLTLREYVPGEAYQVPDYVAWGMQRRGWAKVITADELVTQDAAETTIEMKELRKKE
jgi:hypothetical protein